MAKLIQAAAKFGPRIAPQDAVGIREVAERISDRTTSNVNEVQLHLSEQGSSILYFLSLGMPVKMPGVGIFSLSIDRAGEFKVNFRLDPDLKREVRKEDFFRREILNSENIGITDQQYKELWDAAFPDDPLEITLPDQ